MVRESLWGVIVLVKFSIDFTSEFFSEILSFFSEKNPGVPFVIGLTHCENVSARPLSEMIDSINKILHDQSITAPVIPFDPRSSASSVLPLSVFSSINHSPMTK